MLKKIIKITLFITSISIFAETTLPNNFEAGELISASEMNSNFQALLNAINSLEATLTAAEETISSQNSRILELENKVIPTFFGSGTSDMILSADGLYHLVEFNGIEVDNAGGYTPLTNTYEIPLTGQYFISTNLDVLGHDNNPSTFVHVVSINGEHKLISYENKGSSTLSARYSSTLSGIINVNEGDLIQVKIYAMTNLTVDSGAYRTLSIFKVN